MQVVRYHFSTGINCVFEIPTGVALKFLPAGVQPVEIVHGTSLIGITMFDFNESPVGPYQELVISLYVSPRMGIMEQHPHAGVFPLVVASTHQLARDHAIDLWHLPHFNEDIYIEFSESADGRQITGKVLCHLDQPILEMTISQSGKWNPAYQAYQSFQRDETGAYIGIMDMKGQLSEHEENTGTLKMYQHRLFDGLNLSAMDTMPLREMWMKDGVESYHELVAISAKPAYV